MQAGPIITHNEGDDEHLLDRSGPIACYRLQSRGTGCYNDELGEYKKKNITAKTLSLHIKHDRNADGKMLTTFYCTNANS